MKYIVLLLLVFVVLATAQENVIKNGEFDQGRRSWSIKAYNDAQMEATYPTDSLMSGSACCQIDITNGGTNREEVIAAQTLSLLEGTVYTISFMAMANTPRTIVVRFQESGVLARSFWSTEPLELTEKPKHFGPFTFKCGLSANNRLEYLLGGQDNTTVWLDSVWVTASEIPNYVKTVDKFEKRQHSYAGTTLPYRLCPPDFYDPGKVYPLVLCLHGAGERGTDNQIHIDVHRMATSWADSANQKKYPCFVVAPQCPENNRWADADWSPGFHRIAQVPVSNEVLTVLDLIDSLITEFSVDTNRLYITGLSMGGQGTWDMLARYPTKFAAAVPMSGGGDSTRALHMKHIPIWVFHGEKDTTVPVSASRQMVQAMENQHLTAIYTHCRAGDCTGLSDDEIAAAIAADARLLYTEWQNAGHVMWAESYDFPYLFPWVFAQNKQTNPEPVFVTSPPGDVATSFSLYQNYPNPFNPTTTIAFHLFSPQQVKLELFNIRGQRIRVLLDEKRSAGAHHLSFDARSLSSGPYIYQITAGEYVESRIMTVRK
ncbi:T9SS type A sorting domain-containing protein [candidate division KSB1 bacterium]|nr:T9SS type A sorting domain-containing protein [candidate division KSB1 bacterium]